MSMLDELDLLPRASKSKFDYNEFENDAIAKIRGGADLLGKDGALMPLIKKLVEAALEGEMDNHLSEEKNNGNSNRRNGKKSKTIKTSSGAVNIDTPRDRNIPKGNENVGSAMN